MVGPGTGVAPFRSYITNEIHSKPDQEGRRMELYFGCRNSQRDFYFSQEWTEIEQKNSNFRLHAAFSRENTESLSSGYVQDLIRLNSEEIFKLIFNHDGAFFLAGRAKQMPDQVKTRFRIIQFIHVWSLIINTF